ncbi:MAG: CBS domain-containing protein [Candidatus Dormibacteria bacterium]
MGDIARGEVPVASPDTPLSEVLEALVSTRLNRVVVVDSDRRVLGIISDAELLKRIEGDDNSLLDRLMRRNPAGPGSHHQKTAGDLMVSPVVTVNSTMPINEAIRHMLSEHRKLLPVVDGEGRLRGMVDRADALNAIFPEDAE